MDEYHDMRLPTIRELELLPLRSIIALTVRSLYRGKCDCPEFEELPQIQVIIDSGSQFVQKEAIGEPLDMAAQVHLAMGRIAGYSAEQSASRQDHLRTLAAIATGDALVHALTAIDSRMRTEEEARQAVKRAIKATEQAIRCIGEVIQSDRFVVATLNDLQVLHRVSSRSWENANTIVTIGEVIDLSGAGPLGALY